MARLAKLQEGKERSVGLVDMDGTIADASLRERKFLQGKVKDWNGFFRNMEDDPPILPVLNQVKDLARKYDIVILTGRPEKYRRQTKSWLAKYEVPYITLLMRRKSDMRPDYEAKEALLSELKSKKIVLALDDRLPVCEAYRKHGIKVMHIESSAENQLVNETYRLMAE